MSRKSRRKKQAVIPPSSNPKRVISLSGVTAVVSEEYLRRKASEVAEELRAELRSAKAEGRSPVLRVPTPPGCEDIWAEAIDLVMLEEGYGPFD